MGGETKALGGWVIVRRRPAGDGWRWLPRDGWAFGVVRVWFGLVFCVTVGSVLIVCLFVGRV